ncbi:MAG: hypothetical protein WC586_04850 [Methanoregula sp.]
MTFLLIHSYYLYDYGIVAGLWYIGFSLIGGSMEKGRCGIKKIQGAIQIPVQEKS